MTESTLSTDTGYAIGVDVQLRRGCPYAVLGAEGRQAEAGWLTPGPSLASDVAALCRRYPGAVVGLDCPRQPLPAPRPWYWRQGRWQPRAQEVGWGRHCEVVIRALGLANPQWTTTLAEAPAWMQLGFELFAAFERHCETHEVFPSASYRQLAQAPELRIEISLDQFGPGPKDLLDALVAAVTVREFRAGRGSAVGNGDGFGSIVLPRPVQAPAALLRWPDTPR